MAKIGQNNGKKIDQKIEKFSVVPLHDIQHFLDVRLLGAHKVTLNHKNLSVLGSRKAQAFLYYLAVTTKSVARSKLAALFWPEMAEKAANNNLRTTLSKLKSALGSYLQITNVSVAFNRQLPYQVDTELFSTHVRRAVLRQNLTELQAAIDLYRGEFLQGFHLRGAEPFEEWMLQQRQQFHASVLHALELIMALSMQQQSYDAGLTAGHKLLAMEPWVEAVHYRMMQLYALSGRRGHALQQYEACCSILDDELGVEPTAETTALYHQIRSGQFYKQVDSEQADSKQAHHSRTFPTDAALGFAISGSAIPLITEPVTTNGGSHKVHLPANNLPLPLTTFIGRQRELAYLMEQLTTNCRLVTITGLGGSGKSSLAIALGQHLLATDPMLLDGIFFVPLGWIETSDNTAGTAQLALFTSIAEAVGCPLQDNQPAHTQLIAYLQQRRLLLILDDFEQRTGDSAAIMYLLANVSTAHILITSRTRLNVHGESVLALDGLALEPLVTAPSEPVDQPAPLSDAVALFIDRAKNLDPGFLLSDATVAAITQICRHVAGLPLAIEMTAAWTTVYRCQEIAERLYNETSQSELLTSHFLDQSTRHQTLQEILDDSWSLLSSGVQWTLARLSVFDGAFSQQAAQAIVHTTPADLGQLCDHSLLQRTQSNRYVVHQLIKQFAKQKWQTLTEQQWQVREQLGRAHSRYYLLLVADSMQQADGEVEMAIVQTLKRDHQEIARGWQRAIQQRAWAQIRRSMNGLFRYLELTNQSLEGKQLFSLVNVQHNTLTVETPIVQWLCVAYCHFLRRLTNHDDARQQLEKLIIQLAPSEPNQGFVVKGPIVNGGLEYAAQQGEERAADESVVLRMQTHIFAHCVLGWVHYEQGNYHAAFDCFSTALVQAEPIANWHYVMEARNGLGSVAFSRKEYAVAYRHYQAALNCARQQNDLHYTAIVLGNLAAHAQVTNSFAEAERYLQVRLQIDQKTQNIRQSAVSHQRLGQLALLRHAYVEAEAQFRASLAGFEQLGSSPEIAHVLCDLSKSLLRQHRIRQAEAQCLQSLQLATHAQLAPRISAALTLLAEIQNHPINIDAHMGDALKLPVRIRAD